MRLLMLQGLPGSGKSMLASALGKQLGWPIIDKDDIKDILDGYTPEAGGLAYEIRLNIVRRQLLQGLNVICDSPLTFSTTYTAVRSIAEETQAPPAYIQCYGLISR